MPVNFQQVKSYYDSMLRLWAQAGNDVTVDDVNRALSNWHAVGTYLTEIQRECDEDLFRATYEHQSFIDSVYFECSKAVKLESGGTPTVAAINAKMSNTFSARLNELSIRKHEAGLNESSVSNLRKMHDKFVSVLATLSSNLRTDFVHANKSDQVVQTAGSVQRPTAQARSNGSLMDHDLAFMNTVSGAENV